MAPADILRAARARLAEPGVWVKGPMACADACDCIATALGTVATDKNWNDAITAGEIVQKVLNVDGELEVFDWNDAPERTLDEVLALYDKAIALAEVSP